jgi:hypothetical protein
MKMSIPFDNPQIKINCASVTRFKNLIDKFSSSILNKPRHTAIHQLKPGRKAHTWIIP